MRLWSLHPSLLDRAALVAGWREGLLAQKVLQGGTRGYRSHPQLARFRGTDDPVLTVGRWLHGLADEADARGYRFDRTRVVVAPAAGPTLPVTSDQLELELEHLRAKVLTRDDAWAPRLPPAGVSPAPHPLFHPVPGPVEEWERAVPAPGR